MYGVVDNGWQCLWVGSSGEGWVMMISSALFLSSLGNNNFHKLLIKLKFIIISLVTKMLKMTGVMAPWLSKIGGLRVQFLLTMICAVGVLSILPRQLHERRHN